MMALDFWTRSRWSRATDLAGRGPPTDYVYDAHETHDVLQFLLDYDVDGLIRIAQQGGE